MKNCSRRIPRIPLTITEVKDAVKVRHSIDEIRTIGMLTDQSSQAAGILVELGLTRDLIRQALERLADARPAQVVLCAILRATRFKYFEEGKLYKTSCNKCGEEDGFGHMLQCAGLVVPYVSAGATPLIDFLVDLAMAAYQINAGLPKTLKDCRVEGPTAHRSEAAGLVQTEIDMLSLDLQESETESETWSLGFDGGR